MQIPSTSSQDVDPGVDVGSGVGVSVADVAQPDKRMINTHPIETGLHNR
jgi:hypothetical protein